MDTGPGKKPGGNPGRRIYRKPKDDETSNNNNLPNNNDVSQGEDTPMTEDIPKVKKPPAGRTNGPSAKRKSPTESDSSKVEPEPKRKRQKTDGADSDESDHRLSQPSTGPQNQSIGRSLSIHEDAGVKYKTVADFMHNFQEPKKRVMKTLPILKWDAKANRPAAMIRLGYGNNKGEEVQAYKKQTTVPLRGDRLISTQSTERSSASSPVPNKPAKTSEPNQTLIKDIHGLLNELVGNLPPLQAMDELYTEADYERDSNKRSQKEIDPKNQQTRTCLNDTERPFSCISDIFDDIADKAKKMKFLEACKPFEKQGLHVVTMCSGTESPLLALDLLKRALKGDSHLLNVRHVASAEIEPFKQAYIQRNFSPERLFRDVTEFCDADAKPHTAFGSQMDQPNNVHILVAGSSCIDYSTLNNKRKAFGEKGQSYSTLRGIASYCIRSKPAVVILENVDNAPWQQILDLYRDIGYTGLCFKVDTKDFYIPQTRTRRYIVAFHAEKAMQRGFVLKEMFETVTSSLATFKQRATVPYTHFMYNDDDPELSIARHRLVTAAKQNRDSARNWTACRHRYAAYRAEQKVGVERPYTQWRADGSCLPFDVTWVDWMKLQRERILDTIDIDFLCYLRQREYDMSYKSRWIELSQNVDRDADQRQWGISNCLTPSGMPMDTRRGGPVSGRESLALQGIPADKLLLNKETSAQMQDMAGNAMTTTVVGSMIFSAIIAATKKSTLQNGKALEANDSIFDTFSDVDTRKPEAVIELQTLEDIDKAVTRWKMQRQTKPISCHRSPSMIEVGKQAAMAMQLCRCEGALGKTSSKIAICLQCSHTCCAVCRGNPPHDYANLHPALLTSRAAAHTFHNYVQDTFPIAIDVLLPQNKVNMIAEHIVNLRGDLNAISLLRNQFTDVQEAHEYLDAISDCLQDTLTFSSIKRDKIIRVIYESSTARLEFQVQFEPQNWLSQQQEWTGDLVTCTWLLFAKPRDDLAAGSPVREALETPVLRMKPKDYLLDTEFEFNTLQDHEIILRVTPHEGSQITAWESSFGITHPDYQNLQTWSSLHVEVVEYDDVCYSVVDRINGVYKSLSNCGGANGSLYINVGTDSQHRPHDQGSCLSSMYLFLDPAPFGNARYDSMVFSNTHERLPHGVPRNLQATIKASWRPFQLKESEEIMASTVQVWQSSGLYLKASDQAEDIHMVHAQDPDAAITTRVCDRYSSIAACRISRAQCLSAEFSEGQCIPIEIINQPEALKPLQWLLKSNWRFPALEVWRDISYNANIVSNSSVCGCSPVAPPLKWRLATAPKRGTMIIKPFEDSKAASKYESDVRSIPQAVKAYLHCHNDNLTLDLKLNLDSVAHRVLASFERGAPGDVELKWRIAKDFSLETMPIFPDIDIPSYSPDDPRIGYTKGLQRSCQLKIWQQQSAHWMEQQELDIVAWEEFSRVECRLPALEQRVDVEGRKKVHVKGGVLADAVGSGKTLTSMVLPAREAVDCPAPDHTDEPGLLPLKATLFMIPHTLFKQWKTEKEKYIHKNVVCLYIETYSQLVQSTIAGFQKAHFIFVSWKLFDKGSQYWDQLRKTANAFNVPTLAGRGFDSWLEQASKDLQTLIEKSTTNGTIDLSKFNQVRKEMLPASKEKYKQLYPAFRKAVPMPPKEKVKHSTQIIEQSTSKPIDEPEVAESDENQSVGAESDAEVDAAGPDADEVEPDVNTAVLDTSDSTAAKQAKNAPAIPAIVAKNIAGAEQEIEKRQNEMYQPAQPQARDDEKGALDYDEHDWSGKDLETLTPLLHMFSYRRLVVDEFTYLRDQIVSGIACLTSSRRWMLSGTPPLHNYVSISYMAKLIGTKITPQGDEDVLINFIKANKSLVHDKTSAEEFQQLLQIQSPQWVNERNNRAEAFVKQFVKQNHRETTDTIEYHLEVSDLSLLESYLYGKAFQSVNGQIQATEKVDGTKLQSESVSKRNLAFSSFFQKNKSAVSAMMWCIPLLLEEYLTAFKTGFNGKEPRDRLILKALADERDAEFVTQAGRIVKVLARALHTWHSKQRSIREKVEEQKVQQAEKAAAAAKKGKQPRKTKAAAKKAQGEQSEDEEDESSKEEKNDSLAVYLGNILNHEFGDRSVSEVLSRVVKACSSGYEAICAHYPDEIKVGSGSETVVIQKKLATDLNTLTREAVQIAQERRLIKQVLALGLNNEGTKCHDCESVQTLSNLTVMSLCGHVVCTECLSGKNCSSELLNGCPVLGCSGPGKDSGIPAVRFSPSASEVGVSGTKVSQLLQVLDTIIQGSAGDRVLVFLQGPRQKEVVDAVEERFGADPVVVDGSRSVAKVSKFGESEDGQILILPIDNINAAGWNLQSCNHVVFVRPYVSKTRADWLATRKQAIGRCARHGQLQTVHVYDLLSSATLEMELFQVRLGGRLESRDGGWAFQRGGSPDLGEEVVGPRLGSMEEGDDEEE